MNSDVTTKTRAVWFPRLFGWRSLIAYILASQLIVILTYTGYLSEVNAQWISLCYLGLATKATVENILPNSPQAAPYLFKLFGWRTVIGFLYSVALYMWLTYTGALTELNGKWLGMQFLGFCGKGAAEYASNIRMLFNKNAPAALSGPERGEF